MDANPGAVIDLQHQNGMISHIPATAENAALLRSIDGRKTLKQILSISAARLGKSDSAEFKESLKLAYLDLFRRLEVLDWMRLRHRSMMPYPTYAQMQGRMQGRKNSSASAA